MACLRESEGDWHDSSIWDWRAEDDKLAEVLKKVPEQWDVVVLSAVNGCDLKVSRPTAEYLAVYVGSPGQVAEYRISLQPGAEFNVKSLFLGRAGAKFPKGIGVMEVEEGGVLNVKQTLSIGWERMNNGFLRIKGGQCQVKSLSMGKGGTAPGSILSLHGSKGKLSVEKNMTVTGIGLSYTADGIDSLSEGGVISFIPDVSGVTPIEVGGDLVLESSPVVKVDLKDFSPEQPSVLLKLINVQGKVQGSLGKPEFENLPSGYQAEIEWNGPTLFLKLTRV